MGLRRRIYGEAARICVEAVLPHVPAGFCRARSEKTDEVRHVAAAHEQPSAVDRKFDELGNPPHRLRFNFGGHRRQLPRAYVLIDGRRKKIAQHAERGRTGGDVREKARMTVEGRMVEQQIRRIQKRSRAVLTFVWNSPAGAKGVAHI